MLEALLGPPHAEAFLFGLESLQPPEPLEASKPPQLQEKPAT